MPTRYSNNGFSVTVQDDGEILVSSGDMLSGYSMAIEHDFKHIDDYRHRRHQPHGQIATDDLRVIENKDLILTGERLYHMPTRAEYDRKQQKPKPKITLAAVLKRLRPPLAACMARKVWALGDKPDDRWKAGWHSEEKARSEARFLMKYTGRDYDGALEDVYFAHFDKTATNVFEKLRPFYRANDITGLADTVLDQHQQIMTALSKIALWANKPEVIATIPYAIFVNAWMNRMMRDEGSVLSCYIDVYAPGGLK